MRNLHKSGNWLAIDWGTSSLRVWLISAANEIIDRATSDRGMGKLEPSEFEPALLTLVDSWLNNESTTLAIACGMVGAKQGWIEAPYINVPCRPMDATRMLKVPVDDSRLEVHIIPGISQHTPADVMRGEETQIAGYLADHPEFSGTICLPGTHTKWAEISEGLITGFNTYMSGELYAILSAHSILHHSLVNAIPTESKNDVFINSVANAVKSPHSLTSRLFSLRAESLLNGMLPADVQSALSGYLIGQELSDIKSRLTPSSENQAIIIIGDKKLCDRYALALESLSLKTTVYDTEPMSLNGLIAARSTYQENL